MVWVHISAYGMGSMHVLEGTMNAERYIKVLEQHMLPSDDVYLHMPLFNQERTSLRLKISFPGVSWPR